MRPLDPRALANLQQVAGMRERAASASLSKFLAAERAVTDEIAALSNGQGSASEFPPGAARDKWHLWVAHRRETLLRQLALRRARRIAAQRIYSQALAKSQAVDRLLERSRMDKRSEIEAKRQERLLHEEILNRQRAGNHNS